MGYYANGGGAVALRKDELGTPVVIPKHIIEALKYEFSEVYGGPDGSLDLTFEYNKYHDSVADAMGLLAPYVTSGDVEFTGEDDCHWRFHFRNGKVVEQNGEVKYPEEHRMRTFNVTYTCTDGELETQVDIEDGDFADMVNEMLRLVYQITDESGEECVQIVDIVEVLYDGEEE